MPNSVVIRVRIDWSRSLVKSLVISVDLNMCRHHDEPWFDRPNMQVVDILHTGNGFDSGCDLRGADTGGSRFQKNFK